MIDAREISTVRADKWEPYVVHVGRYGPYVEAELDGRQVNVNIPEDIAPADVTREYIEQLLAEGAKGSESIGEYPGSGQPMLLKRGPYGPYLQLGEDPEDGSKPKRTSLPRGVSPAEVTLFAPACCHAPPMANRELADRSGIGRWTVSSTVRCTPHCPKTRMCSKSSTPPGTDPPQGGQPPAADAGEIRSQAKPSRCGGALWSLPVARNSTAKGTEVDELDLKQALALLEERQAVKLARR